MSLDDPVILHFLQAESLMNYWLDKHGGDIGAVFGEDDRFFVYGNNVMLLKVK